MIVIFLMQEIGAIVNKYTYTNRQGKKCQMNINAIPNNMEDDDDDDDDDGLYFKTMGMQKLVGSFTIIGH